MERGSALDQLGFVVKVIAGATLISIGLKTLGPRLAIPATATASLVLVLLPAIIMGGLLCWQLLHSRRTHAANPRRD